MKPKWVWFSVLMVVIIPYVLFSLCEGEEPASQEILSNKDEAYQTIKLVDGDSVKEIEIDQYITGVLLGELSDDFEMHAMMAQAVAARTYTLRRVQLQLKHNNADVCTDHNCCQAYENPENYQNLQFLEGVQEAVKATANQVLMYNDQLIEATYFSCSGGQTEDAVAVWGTDIPYLRSVRSPGEEKAVNYEKRIEYERKEFLSLLGLPENLLLYRDSVEITYTNGGGVKNMSIGDSTFSGTQLRVLLNLPSTAFALEFYPDKIVIITRGSGHRVGLSQYGADAMAVSGRSYFDILMHYYPGTELVTLSPEQLQAIFDKVQNL